jgi:hypothetical protein
MTVRPVPAIIFSSAARGVISPVTAWVRTPFTASVGTSTSTPDWPENAWMALVARSAGTLKLLVAGAWAGAASVRASRAANALNLRMRVWAVMVGRCKELVGRGPKVGLQ